MPVIQLFWDQNWGGEERRIPGDGKQSNSGTNHSETMSQMIKKDPLHGIVIISIRIIDLCFKMRKWQPREVK